MVTNIIEFIKHGNSGFPIHAGVGDTDAPFEALRSFRRNILAAFINVGLYHDSCNILLASHELLANSIYNKWLIPVIFLRVSVCDVHVA